MKTKRTIYLFAAVFAMLAGAAQATITVSNQFLLDDMLFSINNLGINDSSFGENDIWRYKSRDPAELSDVQIVSATTASIAGNNDSFSAPVSLFSYGTSQLPYYDVNKTTLDAIEPDFRRGNFYLVDVNTNKLLLANNPGATQDYQGWYVITLDTVGGIFTGTSDSANFIDGTATNVNHMHQIMADAWNVLTWNTDPFSGGSIDYTDINSISTEVFYTNVVANTNNTIWINLREMPIKYTTTIADAVDTTAPDAPTGLAASVVQKIDINITWTNSTSVDVASYNVKRSLTSGSGFSTITNLVDQTAGTLGYFFDRDLAITTEYFYVVSAVDHAGLESADSAEISQTTQNTDITGSIVSLNAFVYNPDRVDTAYGVASLSTVVSNWNNTSSLGGTELVFDDGSTSTVGFGATTGSGVITLWGDTCVNTPLRAGWVAYGVGATVQLNHLNENFLNGYYAIVYVNGWVAATGAISDGTTTNYFTVCNPQPTLTQITNTTPGVYPMGNYAVFGSTNAPLTADSIKFEVVGGGLSLAAFNWSRYLHQRVMPLGKSSTTLLAMVRMVIPISKERSTGGNMPSMATRPTMPTTVLSRIA